MDRIGDHDAIVEFNLDLESPLPHGARRAPTSKVVDEEMRLFRAASGTLKGG